MNKKCINCVEYKRCKDSAASWIFFTIGIIATIAIRIVTMLAQINPVYGKIAWYIGVGGFFVFFAYKFSIDKSRSRLISETGLMKKINSRKPLSESDSAVLSAVLCALDSKKERINYIFIFALSAVALIFALYIDIF